MSQLFKPFSNFATHFRRADPKSQKWVGGLIGLGGVIVFTSIWVVLGILEAQDNPATPEALKVASYMDPPRREVSSFSQTIELTDVGVQLMNRMGSDTLLAQFTLILDCPTEQAHRELSINRAKVLDSVFDVANNHYMEDFEGPGGIDRFKNELTIALAKKFKENAPRRIDVKNWVAQ